jgi:hypothetical protein
VGLFMTDLTAASFTANGRALFDAAIGWAVAPVGGAAAASTLAATVVDDPDGGDRFLGSALPAHGPSTPFRGRPGDTVAMVPAGADNAALLRSRKAHPLRRRSTPG